MEEKNDLVQDLAQESGKNLRQYLLLGGGVFVLFVVGIVIAKFVFSSNNNDTEVILPPEIKVDVKKQDTELFNNLPVQTNEEKSFKKPVVISEEKQKEEKTKQPSQPSPQVQSSEKKQTKVESVSIKKDEPKQKETKQQEIKIQQPKQPQSTQQEVKKSKISKQYYIQVAAITRTQPSKKFLELIRKNGFEYKVQEVEVKGVKVKRILVGGFATLKEVKDVLPKVKNKISSSAFIKKLK
jgi:DedD protein